MRKPGRILQLPSSIATSWSDRVERFESVVAAFLREARGLDRDVAGGFAETRTSEIVSRFGTLPFPLTWPVECLGLDWDHPTIEAAHRNIVGAALGVAVLERPEFEPVLGSASELIEWAGQGLIEDLTGADRKWLEAGLSVQQKFSAAERSGSLAVPPSLSVDNRYLWRETVATAKKSGCLIASLADLAGAAGLDKKETLKVLLSLYHLVQLLDDLHDAHEDIRTPDHNVVLNLLVALTLNREANKSLDPLAAVELQVRTAQDRIRRACRALPPRPAGLAVAFSQMIATEIRSFCRSANHLRTGQLQYFAVTRILRMRDEGNA